MIMNYFKLRDINSATFLFQYDDTLLHTAVRFGHLKIVKLLIERAAIYPNKQNKVRS